VHSSGAVRASAGASASVAAGPAVVVCTPLLSSLCRAACSAVSEWPSSLPGWMRSLRRCLSTLVSALPLHQLGRHFCARSRRSKGARRGQGASLASSARTWEPALRLAVPEEDRLGPRHALIVYTFGLGGADVGEVHGEEAARGGLQGDLADGGGEGRQELLGELGVRTVNVSSSLRVGREREWLSARRRRGASSGIGCSRRW